MKKQIPNILTLLNLFSGCIAIVTAFNGNFPATALLVVMAAAFDFLDGFAARILGVSSKIGVELDSLADIVSFGVAPAIAVFSFLNGGLEIYPALWLPARHVIPFISFLIPVFSAYRLAKFNVDERQTNFFLGLPTPANALFWVSYVYGVSGMQSDRIFYLTIAFIISFSLLMVAEIPMFSLKIKNLKLKGNEKQLLLIIATVAFVSLWGIIGVAWGVVTYIIISVAAGIIKSNR